MKKRFIFGVTCFSFLLLGSVWSDQVEKKETVLITATKTEEPLSQATQSYSLVSSDDIALLKQNFVSEPLREVPGVSIVRSGTLGGNTTVLIRGAGSNQSQILIDGIEVNAATVGSFDLGNLVTDNVDKIEIIRGSQSTLYGSEAMGGVIQVFTERGTGEPHVFYDAEGGMNDTAKALLRYSGARNAFDFSLNGAYLTTGGEFDNDAYENVNVAGNFGYQINDALRVDLVSRFIRARKEIQDYGILDPDENRTNRSELEWVGLKVDQWIFDAWEHRFLISTVQDRLFDKDPLDAGETGETLDTRIRNQRWNIESQHNFYWGDLQTITLGFEYEWMEGKNKTTGDPFSGDYHFEENPDSAGVYLQDQFNFRDRFFCVPGVRVTHHSVFGSEVSPSISAAYWVFEKTKLKAGWAEGFRAPSVNELLYPDFGNPDLDAEKSKGWEVGFEQYLGEDKMGFDAAFFHIDYNDLIDFEVISLDPFVGHANNISEAKVEGIELGAFVNPFDFMKLRGSWTHQDTENEITGAALIRRPDDFGSISLFIFYQHWTWSTQTTLVGERTDFDKELEGYIQVNMVLSCQVNEHWTPYLKVENLLDDEYEEASGFPAQGLLLLGGVKGEF